MNQSLIQIRQQRRIYSNHKKYSKQIPQNGSKRNTTLIQDRSVFTNERINKNLRIQKNKFGESSCYCDTCGKRSNIMKKIFQLYQFPQTNQWRKQKQFRKFRRLINCIIFIIVNQKNIIIQIIKSYKLDCIKFMRIYYNLKINNKTTISDTESLKESKAKRNSLLKRLNLLQNLIQLFIRNPILKFNCLITKQIVNEQFQKPSNIQNAILELKQIIRVDSTQQSKRIKQKSKDTKDQYTSLLKGRRNLRSLFFIPQFESPIKQFIIKNSKPNTVHHSPMQSLYDFKISSSFRRL